MKNSEKMDKLKDIEGIKEVLTPEEIKAYDAYRNSIKKKLRTALINMIELNEKRK